MKENQIGVRQNKHTRKALKRTSQGRASKHIEIGCQGNERRKKMAASDRLHNSRHKRPEEVMLYSEAALTTGCSFMASAHVLKPRERSAASCGTASIYTCSTGKYQLENGVCIQWGSSFQHLSQLSYRQTNLLHGVAEAEGNSAILHAEATMA